MTPVTRKARPGGALLHEQLLAWICDLCDEHVGSPALLQDAGKRNQAAVSGNIELVCIRYAAREQGFISVTLLQPDMTAHDALDALEDLPLDLPARI